MVISIEGSTPPQIISPLKIEPSPEMKNKYQLASNIPMVYHIGQVGQDFVGGDWIIQPAVYYLRLVTDPVPVEVQDSESTVKLHEEVFEATYTVDLTKYDFETEKHWKALNGMSLRLLMKIKMELVMAILVLCH